jgi:hypothetical protein
VVWAVLGIIQNIQKHFVVIYEIKSFYVNLGVVEFFQNNIHRANYHFTHGEKVKKNDNTTILPVGCIAYSKRPLQPSCSLAMKFNFHLVFNMI